MPVAYSAPCHGKKGAIRKGADKVKSQGRVHTNKRENSSYQKILENEQSFILEVRSVKIGLARSSDRFAY